MPALTPAVAYARHSDRKQDTSVDQQEAEFHKYAAANDIELKRVFADRAKSGRKSAGRDDLQAMMAYLEQRPRPCKVVLLWASSRLARNTDDSDFYKSSIRRGGYKIVYIGDPLLNVEGPMRGVFESLVQYKDAQYSIDLARDVKRGMLSSASQGHVISRATRGYKLVGGKWEIDPLWEAACRRAWEMRAEGYSLNAIHDATHLYSVEYGYTKFFRNKTYIGTLVWAGQEFENFCPPLCTPDQWARVAALNAKQREHPRRVNSPYLLSGRVYCLHCGTRLKGTTQDQGRQYQYYKCVANKFHPLACGETIWRRDRLDALVIEKAQAEFTPEKIGPLYADWKASHGAGIDVRDETKAKLAEAERAIANLLRAIEQGGQVESVLGQLVLREKERDSLKAKLKSTPPPIPPREINIPDLCARVQARLSGDNDDEKRLALREIVARVDCSREAVDVTIRAFSI